MVFSKRIPDISELVKHYTNYPRYDVLSPITKKRYFELLEKFEPFRKTNNLIDLGCSNGLFLQCAKEKGWNVYGTEFDSDCIGICAEKGITVYKSDQLPESLFSISFDVVTSFEVIEHINNPKEDMQLVNQLLRSGGAYYVTTPNFNSISRWFLKDKWNIIEYPEHLTYYTPRTLHKLLKEYGYKKFYLTTTGFSLSRFSKSKGNEENNSSTNSLRDEKLREKMESNRFMGFVKNSINFFLNLFKIGDAMKGLYQKP